MQNNSPTSIRDHQQRLQAWDKDTERLVLYADFMGFKSRVFGTERSALKNELLAFHDR